MRSRSPAEHGASKTEMHDSVLKPCRHACQKKQKSDSLVMLPEQETAKRSNEPRESTEHCEKQQVRVSRTS